MYLACQVYFFNNTGTVLRAHISSSLSYFKIFFYLPVPEIYSLTSDGKELSCQAYKDKKAQTSHSCFSIFTQAPCMF